MLEQVLRPAVEQRLEIEYVPISYLEEYIGENLILPIGKNAKEDSIRMIKEWVYFLKHEKNSLDIEKLRKYYISTYCAINFVSRILEIETELTKTRNSFLEIASHEPYNVAIEGKSVALDLYFRRSSENTERLFFQEADYSFLIERFEKVLVDQMYELPVTTSAIEKKIVFFAREAYSEIKRRNNKKPLDAQLHFLIAGIINPKMFGISLSAYGIKDAKEVYDLSAKKYGDFELPIPKIFFETE